MCDFVFVCIFVCVCAKNLLAVLTFNAPTSYGLRPSTPSNMQVPVFTQTSRPSHIHIELRVLVRSSTRVILADESNIVHILCIYACTYALIFTCFSFLFLALLNPLTRFLFLLLLSPFFPVTHILSHKVVPNLLFLKKKYNTHRSADHYQARLPSLARTALVGQLRAFCSFKLLFTSR